MWKWLAGTIGAVITAVLVDWTHLLMGFPNGEGVVSVIASESVPVPEKPGTIYVVIDKKSNTGIHLGYEWGSSKVDPNTHLYKAENKRGVVLRLLHSDARSYPLTILTDGEIIKQGQYQGDEAPRQWNDESYERVPL